MTLTDRRKQLFLKQVAIAACAGVHRVYINRIENGTLNPHVSKIPALAAAYRWPTKKFIAALAESKAKAIERRAATASF